MNHHDMLLISLVGGCILSIPFVGFLPTLLVAALFAFGPLAVNILSDLRVANR